MKYDGWTTEEINKRLRWYGKEATDAEFDEEEVDALVLEIMKREGDK